MDKKYYKDLSINFLFYESIEDKEKVHDLEALAFNRDMLSNQSKSSIDEIKK